jgi:DNA-binding winged helix-turn-helix (wHTH) protein
MDELSPFRLDTANQSLLRNASNGEIQRIQLRPKAFSILQYLMDNAGRLVTHDELMEQLWRNTYVQPEVLASHIRDIRAALGDDARKPKFIETVARRGYRFIAKIGTTEAPTADNFKDIASLPLVGRDSPFLKLQQAYHAVAAGTRQLIFVTGEPGIGKTALCLAFLRRLRSDEQAPHIAWGQCIEGYGVQEPYFPILKAVGQLCSAGGEPTIRVFRTKAPTCIVQFSDLLTPEQRQALETDSRGATSGRMLREMLEALEELARSRPVVLVLDDLQWVDHATVDVISEFARRHHPARLLLIGAYRPLEAFLSENPIKTLKDELVAHKLCSEISLSSLTEGDIANYLGTMYAHSELRDRLANLLYRRSEGNPLFMVAALEHIIEQGLLHDRDGQLCLGTQINRLDLDIPRSLRTIIEAQIGHLSAEGRRVLEAASVAGADFTPAVVASAAGYPLAQVEDICHDLARRHQVIRPTGIQHLAHATDLPRYAFVHILYREILYEQQAPGRRSTRHRLIAQQLESLYEGRTEDVAAELALHFEHAADWERAVKYLRVSAENSERRYAHREAIALLSHALERASRISTERRRDVELQLLEKLAMIYVASFDPRCVETYERLAETALLHGLPEKCAEALLNLATCVSWDDSERCLKIAERVSRIASTLPDPLAQEKFQMSCHFWRVWAGGWDAHEVHRARQIFQKLRHQCDRTELARESIDYGMILWASSEYRESYQSVSDGLGALSEALAGQNPYLSIAYQKGQFYLPRALLFRGEWGKALQVLDVSIELADKNGDSFPAQMLRLSRSWIHFHAMDFEEVLAARELVESAGDRFGGSYLVRLGRLLSGSADIGLGNYERATETLMMARDEMNSHPIVLDWCFRLPLQAALSELWLLSGNLAQAREEASVYLNIALSTDDYTYRALAMEVNARVAMAQEEMSVARDLISRGIQTVEERDVPLATWRVHAAAASFFEVSGQTVLAQRHRQIAKDAILSLADSLGPRHTLKAKFLSAPVVARVLREDAAALPDDLISPYTV